MNRPGIDTHRIADVALADVTVSEKTTWRHVLLTTDSGLIGLGEATLEKTDKTFTNAIKKEAKTLLGQTPTPPALDRVRAAATDLKQRTILSALDQAMYDLRAQIAGQPLATTLGATEIAPIPLYANINRTSAIRSPQDFATNASAARAQGFDAIKIAPFDNLTPDLCGTPEGDTLIAAAMTRIRAVRDVVPECELMVDCHWRLTPKATLDLLPALREAGVVWLECPLVETEDAIEDLARIRRAANRHNMRLCGLETAGTWAGFAPFVTGGAYDVIMPDVKHAGGLDVICDIARRATDAGTAVSLHNPSGPVAHLFSVHVMAAIATPERLEIQWNESPMFFDITDPAPEIAGGSCTPTGSPGLGAALKDKARAE